MTQDENAVSRQFGPMVPPQPATSPNISEDRIVARILAALGQSPQAAAPQSAAAAPLSPEDQRIVNALASVHPSGRDIVVISREVCPSLWFVQYSYTPAAGRRGDAVALVFDDGQVTHIFGGI